MLRLDAFIGKAVIRSKARTLEAYRQLLRSPLRHSWLVLLALLLCATGPGKPTAPYLQLLTPGPTSQSAQNQYLKRKAFTVAIAARVATITAGPVTFTGIAAGMKNLFVIIKGLWHRAEPDDNGRFSLTIDLSAMRNGPLPVDVVAWDSKAGDPHYKVELKLRVILFVTGGRDGRPPKVPPKGHPAFGMKLVFDEDFPLLSSNRWYAGPKPDGGEYGMAMFMPKNDPVYNPYTIRDGFLRIRAKHDSAMTDPLNWGRKWRSGQISSAFPNGFASAAYRKGYFEIRALMPLGPGTWPAFWLSEAGITPIAGKTGSAEIDINESYGADMSGYRATVHFWPKPGMGTKHQEIGKAISGLGDISGDFHTYGCLVTGTEAIFYFDGLEKARIPLFEADKIGPLYMLIDLALSADFPIDVPPGGYYDLWLSHVRVYQ